VWLLSWSAVPADSVAILGLRVGVERDSGHRMDIKRSDLLGCWIQVLQGLFCRRSHIVPYMNEAGRIIGPEFISN